MPSNSNSVPNLVDDTGVAPLSLAFFPGNNALVIWDVHVDG